MRFRKLGIVGAGTMGGGIAGLAVSAGIPVLLLDVPGAGADRDEPARNGVERMKKAKPASLMDPERAAFIEIGNTDDDLARLGECDLVIEAIIEQLEPKRALYERLETLLGPETIVASNTSGIPMKQLTAGRAESFRRRFLGMHFFNPPRYLHLLEITPTETTSPETFDAARDFSDLVLGKGIVVARDVPGFIANRLGVYGMVLAVRLMEKHDLSIDDVDFHTGTLLGRAKSATFRTADLSGIDVIAHVTRELSATTGEDFQLPAWILALVKSGHVGEKSGSGFYRKSGKEILTLDWRSGEYRPRASVADAELEALAKLPLPKRFAALRKAHGSKGAMFVHEYLLRFSHYVLETTPLIAYDIPSVDRAMEWGYAWEAGPLKQMDWLGADFLRRGFAALELGEPRLLTRAGNDAFYAADGARVLSLAGEGYEKVRETPGTISLAAFHRPRKRRHILEHNDDASLIDIGDGVTVFEFHSKMNTLGEGVLTLMERALDRVVHDARLGMVIGNADPRTFTAGVDLSLVVRLVAAGDWKALEQACETFQRVSLRLRTSPFPVVAAPFGLTLGGGTEFVLYADQVQAHAELYMGLVETGVGIIPAGGGTTELLFRFSKELAAYADADPFDGVKRAFQTIALAATSTSALGARTLGLLRDRDRVTMNRDRLLSDAAARVIDLAPGYVPPLPRTILALGREGLGNLYYAAWAMHEAGQITDHEVRIARALAYVLTGGDGPARMVTESDILALEREAFLHLLGTKETQERMHHTLKTGQVLRN
jgi:3-hydroxyacyl-CoA dehydrogenase